jgi:hypothetical protein
MFENLTFKDGMFVVIAAFVLMVMFLPFITLPEEGWKKVIYAIELYAIILIVAFFGYRLLKEKSNGASYLTQERILFGVFVFLILIVVLVMSSEIVALRRVQHGFIYFVATIVGIIILLLAVMTNSALTQRYGTDYQHPFTMFDMSSYGKLVESYKN